MLNRLIQTLVASRNEAADDVLLEALRLGDPSEQRIALEALIERQTLRGLTGVIERYDTLIDDLKLLVLQHIRAFHGALRHCGRSDDPHRRLSAIRIIALGHQGKLAYVLSESIHHHDQQIAKSGTDALVALARWVATETRSLQRGGLALSHAGHGPAPGVVAYRQLMEHRAEIEQTVARAIDVHRGKFGPELLRAALLLCDSPLSRTLAILHTGKHGGQSPMVRRLQQPPASEHIEAFLLGATHGALRSHFGVVFSHINEAPVLDALLRRTHWLKDHQLQLCMRQVTRGTWWEERELLRDIERRDPSDAARIGPWLGASGMHDVLQDAHLERLYDHARDDVGARLSLLRLAAHRPRGASVGLLRRMLEDPDERIVRMSAREIVRRRPPDLENMLLQLLTGAPEAVRRVISRAIGQAGFEQFWERFDRLGKSTRRDAGRAMLKILPDAVARLGRRLSTGTVEERLKAMQVAQELDIAEQVRPLLMQICRDTNPKLRSKAIHVLGELDSVAPEVLIDRLVHDTDPRVRANVVEVLEKKRQVRYAPLLAHKARTGHNRERANAIKALHRMKVGPVSQQLTHMLQDPRAEHRISALWALRQIGVWRMLNHVGQMAKQDQNLRVRRYALTVLRSVAEMLKNEQKVAV